MSNYKTIVTKKQSPYVILLSLLMSHYLLARLHSCIYFYVIVWIFSLSSSNFRYNIFEHLSYFDRFDISAVQGRTQMRETHRTTKNKAGKCK